jgi:hypothetical protein
LRRGNQAGITQVENEIELERLLIPRKNHAYERYLDPRELRDFPEKIHCCERWIEGLNADMTTMAKPDHRSKIGGVDPREGDRC